jgi:hypothetical protein
MSPLELGNVLRAMARDIDSQLSHHLNSSRIHIDWVVPALKTSNWLSAKWGSHPSAI